MVNELEDDAKVRETRVVVGVRMSPGAKDMLEKVAAKAGLTLSNLCRQLLSIGLRHWLRGER